MLHRSELTFAGFIHQIQDLQVFKKCEQLGVKIRRVLDRATVEC